MAGWLGGVDASLVEAGRAEHGLPTAAVGRFVACAARPPPWTSLRRRSAKRGRRAHCALPGRRSSEAALGLARACRLSSRTVLPRDRERARRPRRRDSCSSRRAPPCRAHSAAEVLHRRTGLVQRSSTATPEALWGSERRRRCRLLGQRVRRGAAGGCSRVRCASERCCCAAAATAGSGTAAWRAGEQARRACLRKAGRRYQDSRAGRFAHARRARRYRQRQKNRDASGFTGGAPVRRQWWWTRSRLRLPRRVPSRRRRGIAGGAVVCVCRGSPRLPAPRPGP